MLHLKDGVFAEVGERLQLLFVTPVIDDGVQEAALGLLDLWLLPLIDVGLANLKVNTLDARVWAHDFDPPQVGLERVENTLCFVDKTLQTEKKNDLF